MLVWQALSQQALIAAFRAACCESLMEKICAWCDSGVWSAGVLAPSAAFGLVLHDRLRNAGYELSVGDADKKSQ